MITTYRRHLKGCSHRSEGRDYRRCRCPVWVDGTLAGREIRKSLKTRNWESAQETVRDWEAEGSVDTGPRMVTIQEACQEFMNDATARGLKEPSLYKYRLLFANLQAFASTAGLRFIAELDLEAIRKFRAEWKDKNLSALKKLERLRSFFRFAHDSAWIPENPAKKVKNPKVTDPPTMPFTRDDMSAILKACERYPDNYGKTGSANGKRLRALVLLLRYSGLRIRDAVTLGSDRVNGSRLFLYTAKTGVPVWCPLPEFVIEALASCPQTNPNYFFWSGESKPKSAVGDWQRSLQKMFKLTDVKRGHAHRFRDTFAIELLLSGVPLERVSALLGHRSVQITEKHYAPWVSARQIQLEADVRRSWSQDPLLFAETKGTPEVRENLRVV